MASSNDMIASWIRDGQFQNVILVTGAGASTASGIPDYRSYGGIFQKFQAKYGFTQPEDVFTRSKFEKFRIAEDPIYLQFVQTIDQALPSSSHHLAAWLHERGWLRRVYTQNIDGLYQKATVPKEKVVEFHGNLVDGTVVMYGDDIPISAQESVIMDFVLNPVPVDLMIVMGTSLQVSPFCAIPNAVPKSCVRILVDIQPENAYTNDWTNQTGSMRSRTYVTFQQRRIKRKITLRSQWPKSSKWRRQYILRMPTEEFANAVLGLK